MTERIDVDASDIKPGKNKAIKFLEGKYDLEEESDPWELFLSGLALRLEKGWNWSKIWLWSLMGKILPKR